MYSVMLWPWPLTFWPQNLISSSLSRDAPVTKTWWKSVNRYWRYRGNIKLPRESRTDARMHGRTHGQQHGWTTRKHIASAGAYRRRKKNKTAVNLVKPKPNRKPVFCKTEPKTERKSFFANRTPLVQYPKNVSISRFCGIQLKSFV